MPLDPLADGLNTDDDVALRRSLIRLSHLTIARRGESLEPLLRAVARLGVDAIPGSDGVGVTLLETGHSDTIVASDEFVSTVDAIQYGIGQGPCITAAAERRSVHSGDLGGAAEWPQFGPQVAALGVHSVLSLPLIADDVVVGAMNVYAHARRAFTDRAIELGTLFAAPAAVSVHNAQSLFQARRLAEELQVALVNRSIIDQAIGVIMSRTGGNERDAFEALRLRSQSQNVTLSTLAHQLVDEAVRRARARRSPRDAQT